MMSKWFLDNLKQHFVCICCTNQFNPKTEDSSSDKKLERCLPHSIEAGLDLTKKVVSYMRDSTVFRELSFFSSRGGGWWKRGGSSKNN